jgi:hypothetical protein
MAVGKAGAQSPDQASTTGFSFVVPCFSGVDEAAIEDHLAQPAPTPPPTGVAKPELTTDLRRLCSHFRSHSRPPDQRAQRVGGE